MANVPPDPLSSQSARHRRPSEEPSLLARFRTRLFSAFFIIIQALVATSFAPCTTLSLPPQSRVGARQANLLSLLRDAYARIASFFRNLPIALRRRLIGLGHDIIDGANGPPYPTGLLGWLTSKSQSLDIYQEATQWKKACDNEKARVSIIVNEEQAGPAFSTFEAFKTLYANGNFVAVADGGPCKGLLENAGSDACFVYERLTSQPFSIRRLRPDVEGDEVPFDIASELVQKLTQGQAESLAELHADGRLFYVDYRMLKSQQLQENKFGAATEALFYQDSRDEHLHVLAIRTHHMLTPGREEEIVDSIPHLSPRGTLRDVSLVKLNSPVTHTPQDEPSTWMLAKIAFNQNDLWFSQIYHLVCTHEVIDVLCLAAIRSFSKSHPVFGLLMQISRNTFGIRPAFNQRLFAKGGPIDQLFPYVHGTAGTFAGELWNQGLNTGGRSPCPAGEAWRSNGFREDLERRGLIATHRPKQPGSSLSPSFSDPPVLRSFPFLEDALPLHNGMHRVITVFLHSFYSNDASVAGDPEVNRWISECGLLLEEFPEKIDTVSELVDVLCQGAYLSSIKHAALNGSTPSRVASVLPWHPASLYNCLASPVADDDPASPRRFPLASLNTVSGEGNTGAQTESVPAPDQRDPLDILMPWLPNIDASLAQINLFCGFTRPLWRNGPCSLKRLFEPLTTCRFPKRPTAHTANEALEAAVAAGPGHHPGETFKQAERLFQEDMQRISLAMKRREAEWTLENADGWQAFAWTLLDPLSVPSYANI